MPEEDPCPALLAAKNAAYAYWQATETALAAAQSSRDAAFDAYQIADSNHAAQCGD